MVGSAERSRYASAMTSPAPGGRPGRSSTSAFGPWRVAALLVLAPLFLFGPILASGQVFLPYLPVGLPPLAGENPEAAAEAVRDANWILGDRIFPFLTDQIALREELRAGHLPTWQPLQSLGMALFAGTIAGPAYPPNALAYLLAPERAAGPLACLSLVLAGAGLWLFLGRLGLDSRARVVGVLACQLGSWGLANLFYSMKVDAALWFPWALWAVEGLARGRRWSGLALVLALTGSFLGGMVTISIFVLAATALYALVRLGPWSPGMPRRRVRPLVTAAVLCALGVAGASVHVVPLAETARASLRQELSPEETVATGLPVSTSLGLLVPDLFGPPIDATPQGRLPIAWSLTPASQHERAEHANALEWNTHVLAGAALLALVAVVASPRRAAFPAGLLLLVLGFAQAWPLVRSLYLLPGLGLGAPARALALAWFLLPWLAALGVEALLARRPRALGTLFFASFAASAAFFVAWRGTEPESWARGLEETLVARYHEPFGTTLEDVRQRIPPAGARAAGLHLRESLARALAASLAVLASGVLALVLDRRRSVFERGPPIGALCAGGALVLALGLLPLLLPGTPLVRRGPQALLGLGTGLALAALATRSAREELALWLPLAGALVLEGFLGSAGHVQGRAVREGGLFPPSPSMDAVREAAGDGRVLRLIPGGLDEVQLLARPNLLVAYGIRELTPYPTFTPRGFTELFTALDPGTFYRNHVAPPSRPEVLDHPLLDLLRVQALLTTTPLAHPRLAPLVERPGFCVYRRLGALPPARIVPEAVASASDEEVVRALLAPGADFHGVTRIAPEHGSELPSISCGPDWVAGSIAVEFPAANRVRVRVGDSRGGWLVLHEQWAEGWLARVNGGEALPVFRADHVYRAVPVPTGEVQVEFVYAPRSLELGALASAVVLGGVLLAELLRPRAPAPG